MSSDKDKIRVCDGKQKFNLLAIQHIQRTGGAGTSQDYYNCTVCKQYHFFTTNRKQYTRRANKVNSTEEKQRGKAKFLKKKKGVYSQNKKRKKPRK